MMFIITKIPNSMTPPALVVGDVIHATPFTAGRSDWSIGRCEPATAAGHRIDAARDETS
jgi:hypothetical protein